jgi:hypothetical protein
MLHAALLAVVLRAPPPPASDPDFGAMSVSLYDGSARALAAPPPASKPQRPAPEITATPTEIAIDPTAPTDVEPQFVVANVVEPDIDAPPDLDDPVALSVAAAASAAAGSACDLTRWLQAALQDDPRVRDALARIPRPARSVANAIMLWDGAWVAPRATATVDLETVRRAVINGVSAAPEACKSQIAQGPELLSLTDETGTTVVVVGSGIWRWAELLVPDRAASFASNVLGTGPTAKP